MTDPRERDRRRSWLRKAGAPAWPGVRRCCCPGCIGDGTVADAPVRIVIPLAAGSSGDLLARMLAQRLEGMWKQPVIVENRPARAA